MRNAAGYGAKAAATNSRNTAPISSAIDSDAEETTNHRERAIKTRKPKTPPAPRAALHTEAVGEKEEALSFPAAHARMVSHFTRDGRPLEYSEIQKSGQLWMTSKAAFMNSTHPVVSLPQITNAREPFIAFVEGLRRQDQERAGGKANESQVQREVRAFADDYDAYLAAARKIKELGRATAVR